MSENNKELVFSGITIDFDKFKPKTVFIDLDDPDDNIVNYDKRNKVQLRGRKYFIDCLKKGRIDIKHQHINEQIIDLCKKYAETENPDFNFIVEIESAYKECAVKFGIEDKALIVGNKLRMELPLIAKMGKEMVKTKVLVGVNIVNKKVKEIKEKEQILKDKEKLTKEEKKEKEKLNDRENKLNNILNLIQTDLKELGCEQIIIQR